ncbi:MAG: hypothetical protein NC311_11080 [Muribaculaceae bacterium]|nr:hypothetical protein [Muribaculaceae bacterium]
MCNILASIYSSVYGENFDYSKLSDRIKLQKAVYLLENMGITVGDYSFTLKQYGPYSLALDCDAQKNSKNIEIRFSKTAEQGFKKIKEYINEREIYDLVKWMECITTLHYLKTVYRINDSELNNRLVGIKPHLSNKDANIKALKIVNSMTIAI